MPALDDADKEAEPVAVVATKARQGPNFTAPLGRPREPSHELHQPSRIRHSTLEIRHSKFERLV